MWWFSKCGIEVPSCTTKRKPQILNIKFTNSEKWPKNFHVFLINTLYIYNSMIYNSMI